MGPFCYAHLSLEKFAEAEEDCSQALELEDKNVKALFRRVLARKVQLVCVRVQTALHWWGRCSYMVMYVDGRGHGDRWAWPRRLMGLSVVM